MSTVRRSIAFSIVDKYLSQVLLIATTAVMARILTPAETGLFLTANAVILLADNFRSFGVGIYIVQEKEISRPLIRSAFTITLLLSVASALIVYVASGTIASFYEAPELQRLFAVAALSFLVVPFSSPIIALLQRDLAFKALACINIAAALVGAIVTVGLGLAGFGAMSYVWGSIGASCVIMGLALLARPAFWIFRPSFERAGGLLSFGAWSSLITVLNMAYDLLPRLAFGKILGFDAVGLYSRAVTISQLPDRMLASALQPVVLPAMAAHLRAGGDAKDSYLRGLGLMSAVQWPALIMLALLADPVVHVLLGPQWGAAPPLVRLIALANMALAPAFLTFPVLVSAGRIRDALLASLISLPPSFLIVIGAAFISLEAVAASFLIVAPLQMLVAYLFIRRAIGLTAREMARTLRGSAFLALGTALAPALVVALSPTGFDLGWVQSIAAIAGGALGWLAALLLVDHPVKAEFVDGVRFVSERLARLRPVAAGSRIAGETK